MASDKTCLNVEGTFLFNGHITELRGSGKYKLLNGRVYSCTIVKKIIKWLLAWSVNKNKKIKIEQRGRESITKDN